MPAHPLSRSSIYIHLHKKKRKKEEEEEEEKMHAAYLSMITGSDGVSFLFPQLFLSQHRLQEHKTEYFAK